MGGANRLRGMWWGFFFWSAYASFSVGVIIYSSKKERKKKGRKIVFICNFGGNAFLVYFASVFFNCYSRRMKMMLDALKRHAASWVILKFNK